ncbi:hypothetical protein ACRAWD_02275 [Caulobacter segnis]
MARPSRRSAWTIGEPVGPRGRVHLDRPGQRGRGRGRARAAAGLRPSHPLAVERR